MFCQNVKTFEKFSLEPGDIQMHNKAHGIMFHHFHDSIKHIKEQGSLSSEKLNDILDFYSKRYNVIGAREFMHKSKTDSLSSKDVCITFDDGLLCQYDIAFPVLKDRALSAFWFIYTSPLDGVREKLEIYRHFRFSMFSDIEDFYSAFFDIVASNEAEAIERLRNYNPDEHLKNFPFYTPNDKRFRYMRDTILGEEKYFMLMDKMLEDYKYNIESNSKILWLHADNIKELHAEGNVIGLHSYSHPTFMEGKNYAQQMKEYAKNKLQLEEIIGEDILSVSYPCNSYNADTLRCMRELGIQIGFRANMSNECLEELIYEYPREDHANILKAMEASE